MKNSFQSYWLIAVAFLLVWLPDVLALPWIKKRMGHQSKELNSKITPMMLIFLAIASCVLVCIGLFRDEAVYLFAVAAMWVAFLIEFTVRKLLR